MDDYIDSNGNGIPDAFESRLPISEILQMDLNVSDTVIIEVENSPRAPRKGEYYCTSEGFAKADFDYGTYTTLVIRRVISGVIKERTI